jgi:hypothetical protein
LLAVSERNAADFEIRPRLSTGRTGRRSSSFRLADVGSRCRLRYCVGVTPKRALNARD